MKIYSGECEIGQCGLETNLADNRGQQLRVGDIVVLAHREQSGHFCFYGMSAVVDDSPKFAGDSEYKGPFIMGIKKVNINVDENWIVERIKKWEDVLDGEHWGDYGFNYRAE